MQKIVALLTGLTKTYAIQKAITFTFSSFFILLVSCFYTVGVGASVVSAFRFICNIRRNDEPTCHEKVRKKA